jgi:poly-gamma-glutamate capsule biosynthesis protein CapA/YwtB (metallophosphatase superfamily)
MRFVFLQLLIIRLVSLAAQTAGYTAQSIVVHDTMVDDTLTIGGVGDIMIGTNYPAGHLPPDDGKFIFDPVKQYLQSPDLMFGNAEGTFLDSGGTMDPTKCYAFRQPTRYAQYLVDAGFDVMSMANNHVGDFGEEGRTSTGGTLSKVGLQWAGLVSKPYVIFEKDSVKYGFTAFAPNTGTQDIRDLEAAKKIVRMLDSVCDIVIVSFHGGGEGATKNHVTRQTEMFLGENRGNVYAFSHAVIDAGADIVFGHGPHVTRAIELYNDRFIAYSMGNFCTYSRFNLKGNAGYAPIVHVNVERKTGKFISGKIIPIVQLGEGGPSLDPDKQVIFEMQVLTRVDFPETNVEILDDGTIRRK